MVRATSRLQGTRRRAGDLAKHAGKIVAVRETNNVRYLSHGQLALLQKSSSLFDAIAVEVCDGCYAHLLTEAACQ